MITVPTQEIAAFLGNHLDHVLQRTGNNFLTSVAADREFRAGCAIMDVLNAVESVQSSLRLLLEKNGGAKGRPSELQGLEVRVVSLYLLHCLYSYLPIHQNPFLCLFVDIYNLASQDESLKSERFVTSLILNGKGEELAPKTPSELIALSQKQESRPVNIGQLEEFLPEVPIEDQVKVGLGWSSQQKRDGKKRVWETFTIGSLQGDEGQTRAGGVNEAKENGIAGSADITPSTLGDTKDDAEEEEELEEWEIEAERRFQDSDTDEAPSLPAPIAKKSPTKAKVVELEPVMKKVNPVLESTNGSQPAEQDHVKRRRKTWARK
ncbi:hypothetical protein BGZ95_009677 [Linnemannia exigua]|uniref:Uncharacterized protein n=1 Tax=Linnemannia exigua TaxID=604196 RepID=A0AAD4DKK0_9FUNG|nr:hypothetical protein BGZ95_009677 [Linnemannia exigua]